MPTALAGFGAAWDRCMKSTQPIVMIAAGGAYVPLTRVEFCELALNDLGPAGFRDLWTEDYAERWRNSADVNDPTPT